MDKAGLRARMKALGIVDRRAGEAVVDRLSRWLGARLPGTIAAYLAMSDEVEVAALFDGLPGWRWVIPRVEPGGELTFRDREVPREIHRLGMRQPIAVGGVIPVRELDVVLVPGLAFTRSGVRLGRGGGHYDRILSTVRRDCSTVGVTVVSRVVSEIPEELHDQRVGWLATEVGVNRCSTTG